MQLCVMLGSSCAVGTYQPHLYSLSERLITACACSEERLRSTDSQEIMPFGNVGRLENEQAPASRSRMRDLAAALGSAVRGGNGFSLLKCAFCVCKTRNGIRKLGTAKPDLHLKDSRPCSSSWLGSAGGQRLLAAQVRFSVTASAGRTDAVK